MCPQEEAAENHRLINVLFIYYEQISALEK